MEREFSQHILEKILRYQKSYKKRSSGSRAVPCGQSDGQVDRYDETNNRSSQ